MKKKILFLLLFLVTIGSGFGYNFRYPAGGPTSTGDSNVRNVTLTGENSNINYDPTSPVTGLDNQTALVATLIPGNEYSVSVTWGTFGGNYSGAGSVWIDWDQDESYATTEVIGSWTGTPTVTESYTFTVPAEFTGSTRMRVMQRESGSLPLDPAGSYRWGSNMDFTISEYIAGSPDAPALVSPANLASNVAIDTDLTWTTGTNTDHAVLYLADNEEFTGADVVDPASSPYTTSLTSGTTYYWKVVAVSASAIEMSSVVNSFTTEFGAVSEFPWFEDFEDDDLDWTIIDNNDDGDMWVTNYTFNTYQGSQVANINTDYNEGNNDDYLITPQLTLTGNERLKFWYRVHSAGEPNDFQVVLSTTGIDPEDFTETVLPLAVYSNTTYQEQIVDISAYSGNCYLAFHVPAGGLDGWRIYIDNVTVEEIPSTPVATLSATELDFGTVNVGETGSELVSIYNTGAGTLNISTIEISGTNASDFAFTPDSEGPWALANGDDLIIEVDFTPSAEGARSATLEITDDLGSKVSISSASKTEKRNRAVNSVTLTGEGDIPPQGFVCSNPLALEFPAVDVTGNTADYGDDYSQNWISPSSLYMDGDDVVYQFTLANSMFLNGTITTTDSWIGAFILQDEPNAATPAVVTLSNTSTSNTLTYDNNMIPAGTYYLIISSYPSPQSISYSINLTADPLPAPAAATNPTPADDAVDQATALTLEWTNPAYTETIDLYFGTPGSKSLAKVLDNVAAVEEYEVTDLDANTEYNWYVVCKNTSGDTPEGDILTWSFTTIGNPPLGTSYTSPADASTDRPLSGNLSWSAATNASGYKVFLSEDNTFTGHTHVSQPGTTYAYSGLDYETTYYWKIVPYNVVGDATEGIEVWSFTTIPSPFPEADLVFDGVRSGSHGMPMEPYFKYTITQNIYHQDEINVADSAISSISYLYNNNTAWSETIDVYVKHTTKDVFDSVTDWELDGFTYVYSGTMAVDTSNPIVTIDFDTPFVYNNTDNLMVMFFATEDGYHNTSDEFYNYPVEGNRSLIKYSDVDNYHTTFPTVPSGTLKAYRPVSGFTFIEAPADIDVPAGDGSPTDPIVLGDENVELEFTAPNPAGFSLQIFMIPSLPSNDNGLPATMDSFLPRHWRIISSVGNPGSYIITFDLAGLGITNYGLVRFFKRANGAAAWEDVINLGGSLSWNGSKVTISGLDTFSEFVPGIDETLPVTLASFNAVQTTNKFAQINWVTASENGVLGYNLFRAENDNQDQAMRVTGTMIEALNSTTGGSYSFIDDEVEMNTTYYYWLQTNDFDGTSEMFGPVTVKISDQEDHDIEEILLGTQLFSNYPNPFNPSTTISFSVAEPQVVTIDVYNVKGQLVQRVFNSKVETPNIKQNVVWNGKDADGRNVASGIYFTIMKAGNKTFSNKAILLK